MLLTRNFTLNEFTRSATADRERIPNIPTGEILTNLRCAAIVAEGIRSVVLRGRPLRITSGYRCPELNAAVKGSVTSSHLTGHAFDCATDGLSAFGLAQAIRDARIPFDQLILEADRGVVHVGCAPAMRGQVLTQVAGAGSAFRPGLVG